MVILRMSLTYPTRLQILMTALLFCYLLLNGAHRFAHLYMAFRPQLTSWKTLLQGAGRLR